MPGNQQQTQQVLQNLTGVQTQAQPAATAGAVNNGTPSTVYNMAPQGDAWGNWWQPQQQPMNPLVASILGSFFTPQGTPPPATGGGGGGTPTPTPVIPTPTDTGGGGAGGTVPWTNYDPLQGADYCVAADSFMENAILARQVEPGFVAMCHTPEEGFHRHAVLDAGPVMVMPCVELVVESGARLVCSRTTPFTRVEAKEDSDTVMSPDMEGELVYVKRGKKISTEMVILVLDVGEKEVMPISYGGRSFPAGSQPDVLIYSHNMMKGPRVPTEILAQGGDYSMSPSEISMGSGNIGMATMGSGASGGEGKAGVGTGLDQAAPPAADALGGSVPLPAQSSANGSNSWLDAGGWFTGQGPVPRDQDGSVNWVGNNSVLGNWQDIIKALLVGGL